MKTQLLQDIQESGAAAASGRGRTTGRHAPQAPATGAARRAARATVAAGPPPDVGLPGGMPPPPPLSPPPSPSSSDGPQGADPAMPDWLLERLRADAEQAERAQARGLWRRRAVGWSIGLGVTAALAAGAVWLYEDNRVEGALGAVATMAPELPAGVVGVASAPPVPPTLPRPPVADAMRDVQAAARAPAAVDVPDDHPAPVSAARDDRPAGAVDGPVLAGPPASLPMPSRERVRPVRIARMPAADGSAARRRREETLMQCRAHGYDARQCSERACTMTRFGFACRGG